MTALGVGAVLLFILVSVFSGSESQTSRPVNAVVAETSVSPRANGPQEVLVKTELSRPDRETTGSITTSTSDVSPVSLDDVQGAKIVQMRLGELGYFDGIVDGIWGPHSRASLRAFKARNSLSVDDSWDATISTALFSRSAIATIPKADDEHGTLDYQDSTFIISAPTTFNPLNRSDARKIQGQLNSRGYPSSANGIWDVQSREALRRFKRDHRFEVNDVWNKSVEQKLFGR